MRYLGIDYGTKKIGLAIGDDETRIATPLEIVEEENQHAFVSYLNSLIKREGIGTLIIGIPEFSKELYKEHFEKVKSFLCEKHDFKEERVTNALQKLESKVLEKTSQKTLQKWFK